MINMKSDRDSITKLLILQVTTLICMILLLILYWRWFERGFETWLTGLFLFYIFLPDFLRYFYEIPYEEHKHNVLLLLAVMWTYSLYNIIRVVEYAYDRDFSFYIYVLSLAPVVTLLAYLINRKELRSFYKSVTHIH
ncbi:MAG: hypothetical protein WBA22_11585 [Candidatus Methanofastidiosia archaeon]